MDSQPHIINMMKTDTTTLPVQQPSCTMAADQKQPGLHVHLMHGMGDCSRCAFFHSSSHTARPRLTVGLSLSSMR